MKLYLDLKDYSISFNIGSDIYNLLERLDEYFDYTYVTAFSFNNDIMLQMEKKMHQIIDELYFQVVERGGRDLATEYIFGGKVLRLSNKRLIDKEIIYIINLFDKIKSSIRSGYTPSIIIVPLVTEEINKLFINIKKGNCKISPEINAQVSQLIKMELVYIKGEIVTLTEIGNKIPSLI